MKLKSTFLPCLLLVLFSCRNDSDAIAPIEIPIKEIWKVVETDFGEGFLKSDSSTTQITYDSENRIESTYETAFRFGCSTNICEYQSPDYYSQFQFFFDSLDNVSSYLSTFQVFESNSHQDMCAITYEGNEIKSIRCDHSNSSFPHAGFFLRKNFFYDKDARLIDLTVYFDDERLYYTQEFYYDNSDNINKVITYDDEGEVSEIFNFSYGEQENFFSNKFEMQAYLGSTIWYNWHLPFTLSKNNCVRFEYEAPKYPALGFELDLEYSLAPTGLLNQMEIKSTNTQYPMVTTFEFKY